MMDDRGGCRRQQLVDGRAQLETLRESRAIFFNSRGSAATLTSIPAGTSISAVFPRVSRDFRDPYPRPRAGLQSIANRQWTLYQISRVCLTVAVTRRQHYKRCCCCCCCCCCLLSSCQCSIPSSLPSLPAEKLSIYSIMQLRGKQYEIDLINATSMAAAIYRADLF